MNHIDRLLFRITLLAILVGSSSTAHSQPSLIETEAFIVDTLTEFSRRPGNCQDRYSFIDGEFRVIGGASIPLSSVVQIQLEYTTYDRCTERNENIVIFSLGCENSCTSDKRRSIDIFLSVKNTEPQELRRLVNAFSHLFKLRNQPIKEWGEVFDRDKVGDSFD